MAELKSSSIAVAVLSALGGGAVAALLTATLLRPSAETKARPEPATAVVEASPSPLDGRVAALERSLQSLSLRDSMARATAQAAPAPSPGEPPVADVAPIVDNPVFEAAVRDVMERAETERSTERESQRAEWRKQASDEWAGALTEKLRLTELQKAKALEVASAFWDKLRDLRQTDAGAQLGRQEWRTKVEELRAAAEAELGKSLSPAQMNSYRELDEASRLGTRRNMRQAERPRPVPSAQ